MDKKLEEAKKLAGWIEKKSPNFLAGYQKRYFSISEGKYLTYAEKVGEVPKGAIPLEGSKLIADSDLRIFKVVLPDREFILRTPNATETKRWLSLIQLLIDEIEKIKRLSLDFSEEPRNRSSTKKNWKMENLDKEAYKDLQKSGHFNNADVELSKKCYEIKGIAKHLRNIKKEMLDSRIHYGFLQKRHKATIEFYQKRWFFLISSRPLTDFGYDNDDKILEDQILPSFLMFDTLYYYEFENENDTSESKGNYPLNDICGIEKVDENDKFMIIIDMGEKKVTVMTSVRGERDIWFDAMKNSRRTAKDIKNSITKKPRNLCKFLNIIEKEGINRIKDICEDERDKITDKIKEMYKYFNQALTRKPYNY